MPVYLRCLVCKKDFPLKSRKCRCKLTPELTPGNVDNLQRFQYRIKFKRATKWRTKLLPLGTTLKEAKNEEIKLLAANLEDSPPLLPSKEHDGDHQDSHLNEPDPLEVSFSKYYESAKLTKVSYKNDLNRWNKHARGKDFATFAGITAILSTMKENGLAPQTVKHMYNLIRRVHNFHIENDIHPTGKKALGSYHCTVTFQ